MPKMPPCFVLALSLGLLACDVDSSASAPATKAPVAVAPRTEPVPVVAPPRSVPVSRAMIEAPSAEESLDPRGVLDDEERRLLEADDATLTRDERMARAEAQRKLVMADPEHPLRATLEQLDRDVASGEARRVAQERWSGRAAFPDRDEQSPHG